jgi:hypothetical protein
MNIIRKSKFYGTVAQRFPMGPNFGGLS